MPTRQDLIRETLKKLNAIAAGQTPEPEDVQAIDDSMDGVLEETGVRVGNYFNADDTIDAKYLDALATALANFNAPSFGQPQNPASYADAVNRLRYMNPSDYMGQPQNVSYY